MEAIGGKSASGRLEHMKKEREKHVDKTGRVIVGINEIQIISGFIISLHYLKAIDEGFIHDVTSNQYSNFKLVTDILQRILLQNLSAEGKGIFSKLFKRMNRLGEIRNIFAHEYTINGNDWNTFFPSRDKKHIPYRQEGREVDGLFQEFMEEFECVKKQLLNIRNITEVTILTDKKID